LVEGEDVNIVAIIQARMGSTRLPGKIMKEVLGKPLLQYQIERVRKSKYIDQIIIATTIKDNDDEIVNFAVKHLIPYFRGSEEDVLDRYYQAAMKYKADIIVRLTSDCPIIDPEVIDQVIKYYVDNKDKYDYVSNTIVRTYPRGMDTEVFPSHILEEIHSHAQDYPDREHVTRYIYTHPNDFRLGNVTCSADWSKYRWTVDTPEDLELISKIIEDSNNIKNEFTLKDTIDLLEKNAEWFNINADIEQKSH
jgi:spore coat polysaccharide biosynthesis protein SpsF